MPFEQPTTWDGGTDHTEDGLTAETDLALHILSKMYK